MPAAGTVEIGRTRSAAAALIGSDAGKRLVCNAVARRRHAGGRRAMVGAAVSGCRDGRVLEMGRLRTSAPLRSHPGTRERRCLSELPARRGGHAVLRFAREHSLYGQFGRPSCDDENIPRRTSHLHRPCSDRLRGPLSWIDRLRPSSSLLGRRQGVSPACSPTGGGPARTEAGEKSPVTGDCRGRDPREPGAAMPSATQPGGHLN